MPNSRFPELDARLERLVWAEDGPPLSDRIGVKLPPRVSRKPPDRFRPRQVLVPIPRPSCPQAAVRTIPSADFNRIVGLGPRTSESLLPRVGVEVGLSADVEDRPDPVFMRWHRETAFKGTALG